MAVVDFAKRAAEAYEARQKLLTAFDNTIVRVEKLDRAEKAASHTGSAFVLAGKVIGRTVK